MPRRNTVRRLPPEIRDRIGELLDQGRTLDEILAHLAELGASVSRSALGRYKQHIDKVSERIRRSREVAEAAVRTLGGEPESKTTRLNIELLHGILHDMFMQIPVSGEEGQPAAEGEKAKGKDAEGLNPMGAMLLAKALDHLAKAKKSDADLIAKLREQAKAEAERKLDQAAETVAGEATRERLTPAQVLERIKAIYRGEA